MRLGHLNQVAIQQLTTRATGLKIGLLGPKQFQCVVTLVCVAPNISRLPIVMCSGLAFSILEYVWADLKGSAMFMGSDTLLMRRPAILRCIP